MILLSHPTGNQFVRHALEAFLEASLLGEFHTGVTWNPDGLLDRLIPSRMRAQLRRRSFPQHVRPLIRTHPVREAGRLLCQSMRWHRPVTHERAVFSVDSVYRDLDRRVAKRLNSGAPVSMVYAYEDGAAATFEAARARGAMAIYDLPIGYWRAAQCLFREEAEREPEWARTLTGSLDSESKLERKDLELQNADAIIVASSFTKSTLARAPALTAPIFVVPYGAPRISLAEPQVRSRERLRVMYVGTLTQRKGMSYFLRACDLVRGAVEVTLVGRRVASECVPLEAALRRHRYIETLPHRELLAEMAQHDVLVFPSLFEGFGLVILEAMAQGLPVITTEATAGPEVITDGQDGFIVPIRDATAIAERLELLNEDRERLRAMGVAARERAAALGWENYRRGIVGAVTQVAASLQ